MTSTPDTPNMTEAPRIREMHVKIMNQVVDEWFKTAIVSDFNADLIDEAMRVLRSIHEGSVVVVRREELRNVRATLEQDAEYFDAHRTRAALESIDRWLSHTDTTDATMRNMTHEESAELDELRFKDRKPTPITTDATTQEAKC